MMTKSLKKPRVQFAWRGCRVELVRQAERSDGAILPAGLAGVVIGSGRGFTVQFDACPHCGVSLQMSRIRPEGLNILAMPDTEPEPLASQVCTCIKCGCTDDNACIDGYGVACHWVKVDRAAGTGICSQCAPDWLEKLAEDN